MTMMKMRKALYVIGASVACLGWPAPAAAHHLMGERLPATAAEGLLSGLAHPVIGIDHFLTVLLIGVVCARLPKGMLAAALFLLGALGGTGIHLLRVNVPASEALVATSLISVAGLLLAGWKLGLSPLVPLACLAGLIHGYAYGESIVGAEPSPLFGYLAGFTLIQLTVAAGGRWLGLVLERQAERGPILRRSLGAVGALCGVAFLVRAIG